MRSGSKDTGAEAAGGAAAGQGAAVLGWAGSAWSGTAHRTAGSGTARPIGRHLNVILIIKRESRPLINSG